MTSSRSRSSARRTCPRSFASSRTARSTFPTRSSTVAGLEPQQIEELIKSQLVEKKILTQPQVTLVVKQYNSKKISVIGAVQKPGSIPWSEGIKLVEAISLSGGFTSLADADHVRLTRLVGAGKTVTATISVDDITDGKLSDIPLQAGDTIKVDQRVF